MSIGEMMDYFNHPCFRQLFGEVRKKYRSLGKIGGMVRIGGFSPEALDRLVVSRGRPLRLPVFAAALTGDPHALDMDNPLGRLLFYGLHYSALFL